MQKEIAVIEPATTLVGFILISIALIAYVIFRPEITMTMVGKILAFLSLFLLPVLAALMGANTYVEHSKTTGFCLSCHEMQPYGKSLHIDDSEYVPAAHFQNNRVPRDMACFTCHTNYTLYGDLKAKLRGLRHVYVHYLGTVPEQIKLYTPYSNRECLHCHAGARSFEEGATHNEELKRIVLLKSNQVSCLSCHALVHDVTHLNGLTFWREEKR